MAVISLIICIAITIYIINQKKNSKKVNLAWYMILSGGIGNLIDRIVRGYVVDFIATPFIATFNIADSMVVIGVIVLIINEIIESVKEVKNKKQKS
ncbi:MAG: signal peptidase II [Clostridia bacterium]|nr:signal peptidase II [Clostridia bacterium]